MTIRPERILSLVFPDIFEYNEKYKEFRSKTKIEILDRPFGLRTLFYLCYPKVNDISKEYKLNKIEFNILMDSDPELKFIEYDGLFTEEPLNHFIKDDYEFLHLTDKEDIKHYELSYIVKYSKTLLNISKNEWNINYLYETNRFPETYSFDNKIFSKYANYDLLKFTKGNINFDYRIILKRFNDKGLSTILNDLNLNVKLLMNEYKNFINEINKNKPIDFKTFEYDELFIKYCLNDCLLIGFTPKQYKYYLNICSREYPKETLLNLIKPFEQNEISLNSLANEISLKDDEKLVNEFLKIISKLTNDVYNILEKFKPLSFNGIFEKINFIPESFKGSTEAPKGEMEHYDFSFISFVLDKHKELLDSVIKELKSRGFTKDSESLFKEKTEKGFTKEYIIMWFAEMIKRKIDIKSLLGFFDINYRNEFYNYRPLSSYWIEFFREEPPLELYTDPKTYNLSREWKRYFDIDVPKEMIDVKYYEYMIKNNGQKRPKDITAMYTYFSNSEFNKIIFVSTDDVLDKPAKLRYIIPFGFNSIKEFLTEELDISGLCKFTRITNDDWNKISGGHDRIDTVAFSNVKNVYGEYSKLSELIEYFKSSIEVKYNITLMTDI